MGDPGSIGMICTIQKLGGTAFVVIKTLIEKYKVLQKPAKPSVSITQLQPLHRLTPHHSARLPRLHPTPVQEPAFSVQDQPAHSSEVRQEPHPIFELPELRRILGTDGTLCGETKHFNQ